jgi:uncharacterized protein (TIGR03083 family)
MDLAAAVEWIKGDAAEAANLLREVGPDEPVPTCPGWTAADLSGHLATVYCAWYPYNISTPADQWSPEGLMARIGRVSGDGHDAGVAEFEAGVAEFVELCSGSDLDMATWSFGGVDPARWWVRRAGTELTVHLADAASVRNRSVSTSAQFHAEAIDEVLTELFPRMAAVEGFASATQDTDFDPTTTPDRQAALVASDTEMAWTLERGDDGSVRSTRGLSGNPAATGTGSSSDVLAWLHGRPLAAPLTVDGDAALLDEWNLFHRSRVM